MIRYCRPLGRRTTPGFLAFSARKVALAWRLRAGSVEGAGGALGAERCASTGPVRAKRPRKTAKIPETRILAFRIEKPFWPRRDPTKSGGISCRLQELQVFG